MKNGLKGVTDATVFCKSMNKYAFGGVTGLQSPNAAST